MRVLLSLPASPDTDLEHKATLLFKIIWGVLLFITMNLIREKKSQGNVEDELIMLEKATRELDEVIHRVSEKTKAVE